jgi:hypothetical protein
MTQDELDLLHSYLNDTLSEPDFARLQRLLRESAEARRTLRSLSTVNAKLQQLAAVNPATLRLLATPAAPKTKRVFPWLSWRPLTAAAAGLISGLLGASLVFAYAAPSWGKAMSLLQESFESGPAPLVLGVPIDAGKWSGDFAEVVGEQKGVKPESGKQMLRFLRGDFEGRSIPSSHSSDIFRLVDVRPYRREFADGGAVVQLTADFNAVPFADDENFSATLTIFALDAGLVGNEMVKAENVLSTESLSFSRSSKVTMDRNPATWQKVSNELRLPPGTEFLMIRMGMSNDTKTKDQRRDRFVGHFADKVQLVIARRAEIPVP